MASNPEVLSRLLQDAKSHSKILSPSLSSLSTAHCNDGIPNPANYTVPATPLNTFTVDFAPSHAQADKAVSPGPHSELDRYQGKPFISKTCAIDNCCYPSSDPSVPRTMGNANGHDHVLAWETNQIKLSDVLKYPGENKLVKKGQQQLMKVPKDVPLTGAVLHNPPSLSTVLNIQPLKVKMAFFTFIFTFYR